MNMLNKFHDDKITSINSSNEVVTITLNTKDGAENIVLSGIKKLRVGNFEEDNIVSRIYVYSGDDTDSNDDVYSCLIFAYKITDELIKNKPELNDFLKGQLEKIMSGELTMVEIESSYGCYLVAIADSFEIKD